VIGNEGIPLSETEAHNKWIKMINDRLELDCRMTNTRYGTKAISQGLVYKTWKGTLKDEEELPEDWMTKSEVLVGITGMEGDGDGG
jgi:hypothetical protein